MTSAVLTLNMSSTGRSRNPARASTDVSTVLRPSLCIASITNTGRLGSARQSFRTGVKFTRLPTICFDTRKKKTPTKAGG